MKPRQAVALGLATLIACVLLVLVARWLRTLPELASFEQTYPGVTPTTLPAPVGIPAWLAWQHYLNALFLVLIVRSALTLRTKARPPAFYRRRNEGRIRTAHPPRRISVYLWLHLSADALWVLNGLIYVVLLFATGQWLRVVPTDWSIIPNAASAALQYLSFDWPADHAWTNYNALQTLSYFTVVFIAAPVAIVTGLRLSPAWPLEARFTRALPEAPVRRLHNLTLWFFAVFVVVHVTLVLTTGALANLNAMFAAIDSDTSLLGAGLFAVSLATMVTLWFAVRPNTLKRTAARFGEVR